MELITRHSKAAGAAESFKKQYFKNNKWTATSFGDTKKIYKKLISLGSSPEPKSVNEVIGNVSWTDLKCSECRKEVYQVVMVGNEPDHDSETAYICTECLAKICLLIPTQ